MSGSGSTTTKPVPAPRRGRKPKEPRALVQSIQAFSRLNIKLIATELFSTPFKQGWPIWQHTKNPPKSVRRNMSKLSVKHFELLTQGTHVS